MAFIMYRIALIILLSCFLFSGCFSQHSLDQKFRRDLDSARTRSDGVSEETVSDGLGSLEESDLNSDGTLDLNADLAVKLSVQHSRQLQGARDTLIRELLEVLSTRRSLGIQPEGSVQFDTVLEGEDRSEDARQGELSITDTLGTGAELTLNAQEREGDVLLRSSGHEITLGLDQPLLRGRGYENSHRALLQAEHELIYALREFALARQDLALDILTDYYELINLKTILDNTRLNVERSTFLRRRSEAMFKVQMAPYIDVLRSEQQELSAEANLSASGSRFGTAKKRFLSRMGLSTELKIILQDEVPHLRSLAQTEAFCRDQALDRRLDLKTSANRVEDAERDVRVARNRLLPDVNLFAEASTQEIEVRLGGDQETASETREEARAGIRFEIPMDRRDERDAIRLAQLDLDQAQRRWKGTDEEVRIDVFSNVSQLNNFRRNVEIEKENNRIALRRVDNAVFRFKSGELSNRDVVEAENELLDARNALVAALIAHELERLTLLRNMGLLDVSDGGAVVELDHLSGALFKAPVDMRVKPVAKEDGE